MKTMRWITLLFTCSLSAIDATAARAASFPEKPVRLVVGYSPGGGSDLITRIVGRALSESWRQPVVVDNRVGADGSIAATYVANAAPDGYTLIMVTNSHTMPPIGYTLAYHPLKSFAPVSLVDDKPMVLLVNPGLPVSSVKDLIALAKAKPGQLHYGTDGPATDPAFFMALFMQQAGINMTNVNYKGGGQSQIAVASGEIQLVFGTISAALELVKAGRLKALAVTTDTRTAPMPDVPTLAEAAGLPSYNESAWNGILAPARTPRVTVEKIRGDVVEIMKSADMRRTLAAQGIRPIASTPEAFAKHLSEEIEKHNVFFRTLGIR
ncbi:MAG TPA: tripartite tricarboxylate transporter substrate binding protein [Burkholderiales bacterium]